MISANIAPMLSVNGGQSKTFNRAECARRLRAVAETRRHQGHNHRTISPLKGDLHNLVRFASLLRVSNQTAPQLSPRGENMRVLYSSTPMGRVGWSATLPSSGYHLAHGVHQTGDQSLIMLNHDIGSLANNVDVDKFRLAIWDLFHDSEYAILPGSFTSLSRTNRGLDSSSITRVIDNSRYNECVFSRNKQFYLSGYDDQEDPPLYFLCALPHAVSSIEEARQALKPQSVLLAEEAGVPVKRQGDLFFIMSDRKEKRRGKPSRLYGTSHRARSLTMPDGRQRVTGCVTHDPPGRIPDHNTLDLGEHWWWVARNTVPVA